MLKCDKNPGIGANVFAHAGDGVGDGGDDGARGPLADILSASDLTLSSSPTAGLLSLSLAKCELGDAGVTCLCKGLTDNRSLVKLDLGNGAGPTAAEHLFYIDKGCES